MAQKRSVIIDIDAKGLSHSKAHKRIAHDGYFATATLPAVEEKSSPKPGLVSLVVAEEIKQVTQPPAAIVPAVQDVLVPPPAPIEEKQEVIAPALDVQLAVEVKAEPEQITVEKKVLPTPPKKKAAKSDLAPSSS